jgi:hypothetical protein
MKSTQWLDGEIFLHYAFAGNNLGLRITIQLHEGDLMVFTMVERLKPVSTKGFQRTFIPLVDPKSLSTLFATIDKRINDYLEHISAS